MVLALLAH